MGRQGICEGIRVHGGARGDEEDMCDEGRSAETILGSLVVVGNLILLHYEIYGIEKVTK